METKKIVECLRRCEKITGIEHCVGCDYVFYGLLDCYHVLKKDAAKRLEELDAELEKRAIDDRPYEWISVEDRLPEHSVSVLVFDKKIKASYISKIINPENMDSFVSHWMPLPEPPKPKEPTFKDVFLEKFPKAPVDENGIPELCVRAVFPQMGSIKPHERSCGWAHDKCWNQPYFEPEEEGEADA